jgi:hypothetical protein
VVLVLALVVLVLVALVGFAPRGSGRLAGCGGSGAS